LIEYRSILCHFSRLVGVTSKEDKEMRPSTSTQSETHTAQNGKNAPQSRQATANAAQATWQMSPVGGISRPLPQQEIVLQTQALTKVYGKRTAVKDLNLEVARGEVFGLLGAIGAGKTTTIRMLLNLVKPTSGEISLFGQPLASHASHLLPRVGALIERPAFQSYLSGYDNLVAAGNYTGGVTAERVRDVLALVGLSEHGRDRYSTYSLGMRQRLGVGAALLTDPELIILDEPGNGLDLAGMIEMRELVRRLAGVGKTIFMSSHILTDIREVCTRIGIIRGGQLIAVGGVDELLNSATRWEVVVDNPDEVRRLLAAVPVVRSVTVKSDRVIIDAPDLRGRDLIYYLARNGIWPESVYRQGEDLEHVFRELTGQESGL
jgi:ABC-2 type transport system ATP-binding protein